MDDKERVRAAANLVEVIRGYTNLKARGRRQVGLSPFTNEKTPSFYVDPEKGLWHCFSSGKGGDLFSFIMEAEGIEFRDALELLAERHNVELTGARGPATGDSLKLLADLSVWLSKVLASPAGKPAHTLLTQRGFSPEDLTAYGVGAFPPEGGLVHWASQKGHKPEQLRDIGLLQRGRHGDYEPLANRLSFAIHDPLGRVRGFSGRRLHDDGSPKYRNSPESAVFKKRDLLYNFHRARKAEGPLIVMEGYTDVLRCETLGITGAVAAMGTALGDTQAALIRRHHDKVVVVMDADRAGQDAADRTLGVLLAAGLEASVATPPEGEDPDQWLAREGEAGWAQALAAGQEALPFRLSRILQKEGGLPLNSAAAARALEAARPILEPITGPLLRDPALKAVSDTFALPLDSVRRTLAAPPPAPGSAPAQPTLGEAEREEREVARYLIQHPHRASMAASILTDHGLKALSDPLSRRVLESLAAAGSPQDLLTLPEGQGSGFVSSALMAAEAPAATPGQTTVQELRTVLYQEDEGEELLRVVLLRHLGSQGRALRAGLNEGAQMADYSAHKARIHALMEEGVPGWDDL